MINGPGCDSPKGEAIHHLPCRQPAIVGHRPLVNKVGRHMPAKVISAALVKNQLIWVSDAPAH